MYIVLSCFMIAHIFKDKQKVAGDMKSLNLLVARGIKPFSDTMLK